MIDVSWAGLSWVGRVSFHERLLPAGSSRELTNASWALGRSQTNHFREIGPSWFESWLSLGNRRAREGFSAECLSPCHMTNPRSAIWETSVHPFSLVGIEMHVTMLGRHENIFLDFGDLAGNSSDSTLGQIVCSGRGISTTTKMVNPQQRATGSTLTGSQKENIVGHYVFSQAWLMQKVGRVVLLTWRLKKNGRDCCLSLLRAILVSSSALFHKKLLE